MTRLKARSTTLRSRYSARRRTAGGRRGCAGGRPISWDRETYRRRNVVERAFNRLKNWRGLATRYDQHAITYRGGLVLAAILTWANGDAP